MADYKFVDADQLDSDLSGIANAIRKKGGTSASMSFPNGFSSAINAISTGVTVQRKSGTFTTNSSGAATVNCGFKPDAVFFTGTNPMSNNSAFHAGVAFTEVGVNSIETIFVPPSTGYLFASFVTTQATSGFTVKGFRVSTSLQTSTDSNHTVNYIAVKYS